MQNIILKIFILENINFMGMYIKGKKIVIRTRPQSFHFAGQRDTGNNLNHEIIRNLQYSTQYKTKLDNCKSSTQQAIKPINH